MAQSNQTIQLGEAKTILKVRAVMEDGVTPEDISGATSLKIRLKSPAGVTTEYVGTLTSGGVDGYFQYITVLDDISLIGSWKIQGKITMPDWSGYTEIGEFEVIDNL